MKDTTRKEGAEGEQETWYSARLLYERELRGAPTPDDEPLFEDKLIVFRCQDGEEVVAKLQRLAREGEDEYKAIAGNMVRWVFREILEVQDISAYRVEDGTEVYFRWWHDPSERDFEIMRHSHGDRWWVED